MTAQTNQRFAVALSELLEFRGWVTAPDADTAEDIVREMRARGDQCSTASAVGLTHSVREVQVTPDANATSAVDKNPEADLIRVAWFPTDRSWEVSFRASADDDWSAVDGPEEDLDTLLSIARDGATGG